MGPKAPELILTDLSWIWMATMASVDESRFSGVVRELASLDMYKRSQGRRVRQITAAGLGLFVAWGLYAFSLQLLSSKPPEWEGDQWVWVAYGVPVAVGVLAGWAIFRVYNWPRFADFLIATEAEMTKVSWASRTELQRATIVVLATMVLIAAFLLAIDMTWSWLLEWFGILKGRETLMEDAKLHQSIEFVLDNFSRS